MEGIDKRRSMCLLDVYPFKTGIPTEIVLPKRPIEDPNMHTRLTSQTGKGKCAILLEKKTGKRMSKDSDYWSNYPEHSMGCCKQMSKIAHLPINGGSRNKKKC